MMQTMDNAAAPAGIDVDRVRSWIDANVEGATGPYRYELLAGGHSNLTYGVTDAADRRYVLRRPPLNSVLATAHDMGREWRAIYALQDTAVPVPAALGFCGDVDVNGAPFYVMGFVDGYVQHTIDTTLAHSTPTERRIAGRSLFDVLADLHAVDIDAVGLDAHGPRDGYVERQLRRWYKQYTAMKSKELPDVDTSYARLLEKIPQHSDVTVVHGDYRLGNCITSFAGPIAAVLDWEISTLGDPLADLAYLLNTWATPGSESLLQSDSSVAPTMADGFEPADVLLARYSARSGRDVSHISFYIAFNHWKTACIVQGVLSRYLSGALGDTSHIDLVGFANTIENRAEAARLELDKLG